MRVETTDRYIAELNAVKNYSRVSNERNLALERSQKLETALSEANKRVDHLEKLPSQFEGKTYEDAEKAFLEAKQEEIKRQANESFLSTKSRWEYEEKPKRGGRARHRSSQDRSFDASQRI